MKKFVAITLFAICAPLLAGSATEPSSSNKLASVPLLIEGLVGEWTDVHTAEYASKGWRDYEMGFVNRVEQISDSRFRIHRVNGAPPLEVVISPSKLTVSWPDGYGDIVMVSESEIERFDLQGPTDWNCLIRTNWNGQERWMEMILSGDMFTYLRWQKGPSGDRRYTRIHFMKRVTD